MKDAHYVFMTIRTILENTDSRDSRTIKYYQKGKIYGIITFALDCNLITLNTWLILYRRFI